MDMDVSLWLILIAVILSFFLIGGRINDNNKLKNAQNYISLRVKKLTIEHQKTLLLKRSQLILDDDYGSPDHTKWDKELNYFINTIIQPSINLELNMLNDLNYDVQKEINHIYNIVEGLLDQAEDEQMSDPNYKSHEEMSPNEYEHYCADLLREKGWEAKVTKASGDQGVDIIATRGRLKIAVQCKLYAKPVGNKAVQEIRTGVEFVEADYGVVVAPKGFTRSAKELANKTGVKLMHHSELQDIVQAL